MAQSHITFNQTQFRLGSDLSHTIISVKFSNTYFRSAESEGFEPPVQLPVHRISSAARSTTPAAFLIVCVANV